MPTRIRKDVFCSLLPRPGQNPCQTREMTFPPIMAYMSECAGHNLLMRFFTLGSSKIMFVIW